MVTHEPADDNMHREYKRQQKRLGAELSQAGPNQALGGSRQAVQRNWGGRV